MHVKIAKLLLLIASSKLLDLLQNENSATTLYFCKVFVIVIESQCKEGLFFHIGDPSPASVFIHNALSLRKRFYHITIKNIPAERHLVIAEVFIFPFKKVRLPH